MSALPVVLPRIMLKEVGTGRERSSPLRNEVEEVDRRRRELPEGVSLRALTDDCVRRGELEGGVFWIEMGRVDS